jgi:hypothetical protein
MPDLAAFQDRFARAILADDGQDILSRQKAFAVYRNTSARGAVEALRAAYPTVDMLVGEEMFTQVALDYRREQPPSGPVLSEYGADFAGFLARQPWSCELPYLADVARVDRLWLESFLAAESTPARRWFGATATIRQNPATRFVWLETPAMTIWQAHRDPWEMTELDPDWIEEGALFTRIGREVRGELIDRATYCLLLSCAEPTSVADCVTAVAADFPEANIPMLLNRCFASGALIIQ